MNYNENSVAIKTTKKKKRKKITKDEFQLYSLCSIPILLVFVFNYLPMFGIIIAFKEYRFDKGIFGSEWVGFRNMEFFLRSNEFMKLVRNTLCLNSLFIVVGILAALTIAILLFYLKSRTSIKIFQTTLITPNFISWVIVSYMAYAFLNPSYGILNGFLQKIGFEKVDWYNTPNAWPWILTIAGVWKNVGMDCVIYYAALMGIDTALFEAADIDGATKWQKVKAIIIPSLVSLITILTILKIGGIFHSDFGMFYQLTRDVGSLYDVTDVIDTYVFRTMRVIGNMGMGASIGLLQSTVGIILVLLTNYASKKIDRDNGLF
jgi:putative aldouronate transport system permease protein